MYNDQISKLRRQKLRKNSTEAEKILWECLRDRKLNNLKFYRQYSVGPYILDFFCPKLRLGIELDGEHHKNNEEYDQERNTLLEKAGITTMRFWNNDVFNNLKEVLEKVAKFQRSDTPLL